eukprot:ctg_611.g334
MRQDETYPVETASEGQTPRPHRTGCLLTALPPQSLSPPPSSRPLQYDRGSAHAGQGGAHWGALAHRWVGRGPDRAGATTKRWHCQPAGHGGTAARAARCGGGVSHGQRGPMGGARCVDRRQAGHWKDGASYGYGAAAGAVDALHQTDRLRGVLAGGVQDRVAHASVSAQCGRAYTRGDRRDRGRGGGVGHRYGDGVRAGAQDDGRAGTATGESGRCGVHRQGQRARYQARSLVRPLARLRRHRRGHPLRGLPRGRGAKAPPGGASGVVARYRRDQFATTGISGALLGRHRRDQTRGARADRRQSCAVVRGRQGGNGARGAVYRRGAHTGHGVLLVPEPHAGIGRGAAAGVREQPRRDSYPRHRVPVTAWLAGGLFGPSADYRHRAVRRRGVSGDSAATQRGGGRGGGTGGVGAAHQNRPGDQFAIRHVRHDRQCADLRATESGGGGGGGCEKGVCVVYGHQTQHAVRTRACRRFPDHGRGGHARAAESAGRERQQLVGGVRSRCRRQYVDGIRGGAGTGRYP